MTAPTEFLLARIAKDEADARHSGADAMTGYRWKHYPRDAYEEIQALALSRARRMLAECEAKRLLIQRAESLAEYVDGTREDSTHTYERTLTRLLAPLSLPYADHPDYLPEWRA